MGTRRAGSPRPPGSVSCLLGSWFSGFVFGSVVTAPYGHGPDLRCLKINIHAYFRRETSGIQNVVFGLRTYPTLTSSWGGGCSPNPGDTAAAVEVRHVMHCTSGTKVGPDLSAGVVGRARLCTGGWRTWPGFPCLGDIQPESLVKSRHASL